MSNRFENALPYFLPDGAPVRMVAEKVAADPKWVNATAEVTYRCKERGCLLAAVIRYDGQRYLYLNTHNAPHARDGRDQPRMDVMHCYALNEDYTAQENTPLGGTRTSHGMGCDHARYLLTTAQLASDVARFRGERRRVVIITGTNVPARGQQEADIPVVTTKVR